MSNPRTEGCLLGGDFFDSEFITLVKYTVNRGRSFSISISARY